MGVCPLASDFIDAKGPKDNFGNGLGSRRRGCRPPPPTTQDSSHSTCPVLILQERPTQHWHVPQLTKTRANAIMFAQVLSSMVSNWLIHCYLHPLMMQTIVHRSTTCNPFFVPGCPLALMEMANKPTKLHIMLTKDVKRTFKINEPLTSQTQHAFLSLIVS